jgi:hypothetical protein
MDDDIMPVSKADAEKRKKNKRKTPDVIAEPEDNVQPEAPTNAAVKMEQDACRPDEAATDNITKPEEEDTDKAADRDYELYIERLKKLHEAHQLTPPRIQHT